MSLTFADLKSTEGLTQLNNYFLGRTFTFGIGPSSADTDLVKLVGACPDATKYPHAARWFNYTSSVKGKIDNAAKGLTVGLAAAAAPAAAADDDEDDDSDDLFGDDDDEEDDEEMVEVVEKMPNLRERTQMVLEIKPADDQVDLESMGVKVKKMDFSGWEVVEDKLKACAEDPRCTMKRCIQWGLAHEIQPVAYTINKLVVSCVVLNDIVDSDDIIEMLSAHFGDDLIQSIDMVACNKAEAWKLKNFVNADGSIMEDPKQ